MGNVFKSPARVRAAAMRRADRHQRIHPVGHAQMRDHMAGIQPTHRMRDDDDLLPFTLLKQNVLQLLRPQRNASGRMHFGHDQPMPARLNGGIDPAEVRHLQGSELEIAETEEAVVEDDWEHGGRIICKT